MSFTFCVMAYAITSGTAVLCAGGTIMLKMIVLIYLNF